MLNIQGLDPSASSSLSWKVPYLDVLVNSSLQHYSVISITETHVKDQINDAQMNITGYNVYRSDRTSSKEKGGCCLYIQESLNVSNHSKYDDDYCEVVCCCIDTIKTLVFSVYRPAKTPHQKFEEALHFIQSCINLKDES